MAIRSVFGNREVREKKALANRDYYKTLIDNRKDATFLADIDGDLFLLNKKAQLLTGYTEEEIKEYHVRDLFITIKNIENPFDSRQFSEFTSRLFLLDSRRYMIPVVFDFKEIEGQKFLCTCIEAVENESSASVRDNSAQLPGEQASLAPAAVKTEAAARWPVDFEHQVRNLLNSILGFGSIIIREPVISGDKKLLGNLESIMRSGNQLKKLFNQNSLGDTDSYELNRVASLVAPVLQKTSILLEPLARHNNLHIQIKQSSDIKVITDEFLLLELLKYLIGKALMYTRHEEVLVEVKEDRANGKGIIIIDNLGQDIPQGVINFIKRENSKEQYDLANPVISQNQEISTMLHSLNRIDGKITFTTDKSMGEIAQIILPLALDEENIDDLATLEKSIQGKSLNILIVEDEKFTARILQMYLENISAVSLAYSGNEALNIVEIFYNKGIVFHAVIMDIGLPKPWDGILLKNEIEKRWPEYQGVPFLAQTAFTAKSYTDRIMESKFRGHLIKPINRNDILLFIDKYCR